MATLYIKEYQYVASTRQQSYVQIGQEPPVAEQTVAIGGASAQSAAFNANTQYVRLHTDAICSVAFGANPTATISNGRMAANQTEYFGVVPGQKLAVITNT